MFNFDFKDFYTQHQRWVKTVLVLFAISIVVGGAAVYYYPDLMEQISANFEQEFGANPPLDINLAIQIFLQNIVASLVAWLGGFLLGVLPVLVVVVNGFILGYVALYIILASPSVVDGLLLIAAGLLPHGIFEIPAFLLAAVLGMKLGLDWLAGSSRGNRWLVLKSSFISTSKYFVYVFGALVIAAIIEVFISGKLVSNF